MPTPWPESWGQGEWRTGRDAAPVAVSNVTYHVCSSSAPLPALAHPGCPGRCYGSSRTRPAALGQVESSRKRDIDGGVGRGDEWLPVHPRLVTPDLLWPYPISCQTLLPSGTCQRSPAPPGQARHSAGCSTEGDGTAQHRPPPTQTCTGVSPRLGHKQRDRQISSYRAHRQSWGLWSEGPRGPCSSGRRRHGGTQRHREIRHELLRGTSDRDRSREP